MMSHLPSLPFAQARMYGDDVGALVVDPGTLTTKIGYAGEDCPKFVPSSVIGINTEDNSCLFPLKENMRRDHTIIKPALRMESGLLTMDGDAFETIIEKSLGSEGLRINPADHPILFSEPNRHNHVYRERVVEFAFERLGSPAVFVAKKAVLSCFSAARSTALVVDIGHSGTSIAPVVEGYCLQRTLKESHMGGAVLEAELAGALTARGYNLTPSFAFSRPQMPDGSFAVPGSTKNDFVDTTGIHPTYSQWATQGVIRELKETFCRVGDHPIAGDQLAQLLERSRTQPVEGTIVRTENTFLLPDGTAVDTAPHAKLIPEALFNPEILRTASVPKDFPGLGRAVHDVLLASDADVRRELASAILLSGGSSQFDGLPERLTANLSESGLLGTALKFKVHAPSSSADRKFAAWIGGSIFASLGSFQQLWISKAEYDEHGPRIVEKKCA